MTEQEAAAFVQLLQRMLLTQAEALWVMGLIERLTIKAKRTQEQEDAQHTARE